MTQPLHVHEKKNIIVHVVVHQEISFSYLVAMGQKMQYEEIKRGGHRVMLSLTTETDKREDAEL